MDNLLWEEVVKFHGHKCPGIAIGFRACEAIINKMNINLKEDKITCITENNTCPVDAIKYVFGCDYNKHNLILEDGKEIAFNIFYDNKSLRIVFKGKNNGSTKEEFMNSILKADVNDIFDFTQVKYRI